MKVLLIQSYLGPDGCGLVYPLGLAYVGAAVLAKGHEVRILDSNTLASPHEAARDAIRQFGPDCVGLSLRNVDNQSRVAPLYYYAHFRELLATVRKALGSRPIVVGGTGYSMFARPILERNPAIDFGLYLEAEESFPELLEHLGSADQVRGLFFRRQGDVVYSGDRPLPRFEQQPFPARGLVDLQPYRTVPFSMGVQTKRGCPLRCAYCNYPQLNGAVYRVRSAQSVGDEVEHLVRECGFREFAFTDSVLNLPAGHAEAIFRELSARRLPVQWSAYMHLRGVDRDTVRLALDAGCSSLLFSPDGISQAALDGLQKDLRATDLHALVRLLTRTPEFARLHVGFAYFLNPPGETWGGLLQSLAFFVRTLASRLRRHSARVRPYVGWIRLEPGTRVYERALAEGTVSPDVDLLPESQEGLKQTFYRHPRLGFLDPVLLAGFGLLSRLEQAARRRRRAAPAGSTEPEAPQENRK